MCDWDSDDDCHFPKISPPSANDDNGRKSYNRDNFVPERIQFGRGRQRPPMSSRNSFENRRFQNNFEETHSNASHTLKMLVDRRDVGKIIGKGGSKIKELQQHSNTRIKVDKESGSYNDVPVEIAGEQIDCEATKKLIIDLLQDSFHRKPFNKMREDLLPDDGITDEGFINWSTVNTQCREQSMARWADLPAVLKNFYIEDDDVADMSTHEAANWRTNNFNLSVVDLSAESRPFLNPVQSFEQAFCHYPDVLTEIHKQGFKKPSPIQSQMWPFALRGYDVIGIAQTGTGKTLAFLLPAFIHIDLQPVPRQKREGPSAVVLTPTRELALQIEQEIKKYTYRGIRCVCVYGGGDRRRQIDLVMSGVEIIVATPGRFNDLLSCDIISLKSVTFLVLDEADRMLDMGFEPQIMKILIDIRPDRQTLMTSATWPSGVRRLALSYMKDPFQINVGSLDLAATHTVQQIVEIIPEEDKRQRLLEFLADMQPQDKALVFVGKKIVCDDLSSDLCLRNVTCQSIHGGREQADREQALEDFKTGLCQIDPSDEIQQIFKLILK